MEWNPRASEVSAAYERNARDFERFPRTGSATLIGKRGSSRLPRVHHPELSVSKLLAVPRILGRLMPFVRLLPLVFLLPRAHAANDAPHLRLYAIDCGRIVYKDMAMFSDTGDYDGKPGALADPCFLIRNPHGTLLWDTGLGDKTAASRDGVDFNGIRLYVDTPLQDQLKTLGLKPDDINYVAFSHFHLDHTGNANLFTHSTWIINKAELEATLSSAPPFGADKSLISAYEHVKTQLIEGDYDVFGDGSVRILKAPGHTPGHQVLIVELEHAGTVALTGDLYHTRENRRLRRVPEVNTQRADTLASMDRFEHIVSNLRARVIVQHDPQDFRSLPKFPGYLD
jgi:N-acyl homoserine lactone hydrolase